MAFVPQAGARPQIYCKIGDENLDDLAHEGMAFTKFQYKAMVNGGYIVKAELSDPHSNLLRRLLDQEYLELSRTFPITLTFQIKWNSEGEYPEQATKKMVAFISSLRAFGDAPDICQIEFTAIDPPSWYLNSGNAPGVCMTGRVSDVIKQVVEKYAPAVNLEISKTNDSDQNHYWMMRQDPKTFISSLLEWSSAVTQTKTQWIIIPGGLDGTQLIIKEQGAIQSQQRGFYSYRSSVGHDSIKGWELIGNNAMSLSTTKIITSGLSAISGQYLDKIVDKQEQIVFVKDSTTSGKQTADVTAKQSYTKPDDSVGNPPPYNQAGGWTSISAIPEIYSAGDIGRNYDNYIDGRARGVYLGLVNRLFRARFQVVGHGIWSDCNGLGIDTIYVKWLSNDGSLYFLSGNWLVTGFCHTVTRKFWFTDLYCARADYDASGKKVKGSDE